MVKIRISENKAGLAKACHDILRALLGNAEFLTANSGETADLNIYLKADAAGGMAYAEAEVLNQGKRVKEIGREALLEAATEANQQKRLAKLVVYRAVIKIFALEPLPWGILTGIRPAKIVHRLMDSDMGPGEITGHLIHSYDMSNEKAQELVRVALNNRKYLLTPLQAKEKISVYIGIPFCPTRCAYCSFPAYPADRFHSMLQPFLEALGKEIEELGRVINEKGLKVHTIYIGGGTPTTLDENQLYELLNLIKNTLVDAATEEITLEAGRPDTITKGKLKLSKEAGVTRLSINPQSMNEVTLKAIGRMHSPGDVREAFGLAREAGFTNINMDLIVGLPGERCRELANTLNQIEILSPENITVHTMAVKRASHIRENVDKYNMPSEMEVNKMLKMTGDFAEAMNMHPYYLYRQKYMVGPMENKGYARNGFDCIYNIQVIEERQTIVGLGAGAGSKFVNPEDWTLESHYNPKDPEVYIRRIGELINRKKRHLNPD